MEEAELGTSAPSQIAVGFPPYRRSHLQSQTYHTLVRILSHCYDHSQISGSTQIHDATQQLKTPDYGSCRMRQENQERESECFEFVASDFLEPKDLMPQRDTQVRETTEGVEDKGREYSANKMVVDGIELMMREEEVEDSSRRHVEAMSVQENCSNQERKLMDELELIVKGTENVRDSGLIPSSSGLDEKQSGSSEVELMDYHVEHVEFQHCDVSKSGSASELQVQGEFNQHDSEGFNSPLIVEVLTSTKGQTSTSVTSTSSVKHERQQTEMELAKSFCDTMGSLPTSGEAEFEREEQCGQKVAEAMRFSLEQDMNIGLLDAAIIDDNQEMQKKEEKSEKSICVNDATISFNHLTANEDMEEGEISGDFGMDSSSYGMSSADTSILQQKKVHEVQNLKNVIENIPCDAWNGEKGEGYESNSFMVNALQDTNNSGKVEPRTSDRNGTACGVQVLISQETIECDRAGECGSALKAGNSEDKHTGSNGVTNLPTYLAHNQVLQGGFLKEGDNRDHENSSAVKEKVDVSSKKKRGPITEERKAKKKLKKRKKRAEKNRQLGVKRLKLPPVQKPKTIKYCRHYLKGRCHEGDKCHFSHDTVPLTKSKPCCHFARHSCMKGDDCPFDHQLSKYPCSNFVSRGSCCRGDVCMFSHQVPTKQDTPMPSDVSRAELKPPLQSGDANFSMPLNNGDCSSFQISQFSNSAGIHSQINKEHVLTNAVQKQPTPTPKGISFINVAKSSLLGPSTPKQDMVTPNKESHVQIGTHVDQSASGTNLVEIPKKLPAVAPKGINFLSFGKAPVCSYKSSVSSLFNRGNGIKLPQLDIFGLPEQATTSLSKNDSSKVGNGTKRSVPQAALFSNEMLDKTQSVTEGMNLNFPGKSLIDDSATHLQGSLHSPGDHSHGKSVQGVKAADNCQTSSVTSSILPVYPFVLHQSSEHQASRCQKHVSNSGQKAILSTLAFAAKHQSDIKMK